MSIPSNRLSWRLSRTTKPNWLPSRGKPVCIWDWIVQKVIKILAFLPVYTALVVTIILYLVIFGVPFIGGR